MQYHVRDLFWLIALAALAIGWWVDHCKLRETIEIKEDAELFRTETMLSDFDYQLSPPIVWSDHGGR